jgi:aconitate hydratase
MGVLPLQFAEGTNAQTLKVDGSETYAITGLSETIEPGQTATLEITRKDGSQEKVPVKLRIDTPIEIDYYRHGGILPFVLRELMAQH